MVISCCLVPTAAQIYDEEVERGKRRSKNKNDEDDEEEEEEEEEEDEEEAGEVSWKRNKSKSSKSKSSKSRKSDKSSNSRKGGSKSSSKSKSKDRDSKKKKKSKKEKTAKTRKIDIKQIDSRDEELEGVVDEDMIEAPKKEYRKADFKPSRNKTVSVQLEEPDSEWNDREPRHSVFRGPDVETSQTLKSDPQPSSLHTSILNDSFYSDDSFDDGTMTFEVDYSTSTPLFEALESNDWGNVLFFLRAGKFFAGGTLINESLDKPDIQVRTWVHCRDEHGELMWRQLPLHAAICLAAPLVVIQRLVEIYPDALACPDSFGNLPLNLAAKLHGTQSYIFQVVSMRSQRWLQTRQDSDDDDDLDDLSNLGTRERVGVGSDQQNSYSSDRPQPPELFERPLTPANSSLGFVPRTIHQPPQQPKNSGMEPKGTPTSAFVERLRASYDETYSSESVETVETEYKIYGTKMRPLRPNDSQSFAEEGSHAY